MTIGEIVGAWPDIFEKCKRVADEICKGPAGSLGISISTISRFHDGVKALVTTRLMKASTGQRRDQVYEYLCRPSGPAAALLSSFACVLGEL